MAKQIVTWDSVNKHSSTTLSSNNLGASTLSTTGGTRSTLGKSSGKWYLELSSTVNGVFSLGIIDSIIDLKISATALSAKQQVKMYTPYAKLIFPEATTYGTTPSANDTYSILLDLDNNKLEFYRNGLSVGVSHTNLSSLIKPIYIFAGNSQGYGGTNVVTANFGATPFKYPIPAGYNSYDTEYSNKFLISSEESTYSLYKKVSKPLVPLMGGYDNAVGSAIGSASYSTGYTWKAFDNDDTTVYTTNFIPTSSNPVYIGYRFNDPVCAKRYSFLAGLRTFKFMASNNGTTWDTLDTQTALVSNTTTYQTFDIKNEKFYNYYKIEATLATSGNDWISIRSVQFYGLMPSILLECPSSEESYIRNGMDKGFQIDTVEELNVKQHIKEASIPLGSGKVFKQKIDRSKHRAKKIILG